MLLASARAWVKHLFLSELITAHGVFLVSNGRWNIDQKPNSIASTLSAPGPLLCSERIAKAAYSKWKFWQSYMKKMLDNTQSLEAYLAGIQWQEMDRWAQGKHAPAHRECSLRWCWSWTHLGCTWQVATGNDDTSKTSPSLKFIHVNT